MRTLTDIAKHKIAKRFSDSIVKLNYKVNGKEQTTAAFNKYVEENRVKIVFSIPPELTGTIDSVHFLDKDGDVVIKTDRTYLNEVGEKNGLAIVLEYEIDEVPKEVNRW